MKLKELFVSLLTDDERVTAADRLVSAIPEAFTPMLSKRSEKTTEASGRLSEALNTRGKNPYTPKLKQADEERDYAFLSFKYGVHSALRRKQPAIAASAKDILTVMESHDPQLNRMGYIAQTSEMKSLIQALKTKTDVIEQAGLTLIWEEMKEAAAAFEKIYQEKVNTDQANTTPRVIETRRVLDYQLGLLLDQVGIFLNDEEPGIEELVEKFNVIITDVMTIARARQTREAEENEGVME